MMYSALVFMTLSAVSTARTNVTLDVRQQPNAVYNKQTGQYHLELSCSSSGNPPSVIWMTPSQQTLQSSDKNGDMFSLLLPNPVSGGNYTCCVPPDSPPATCLPRDDPALEGATIFVDKLEARTTVLEARLSALQVKNSEQKTQITALTESNLIQAGRLSVVHAERDEQKKQIPGLIAVNDKIDAELSALRAENSQQNKQLLGLTKAVQPQKDAQSKRAIFHAQLGSSRLVSGNRIKPDIVHANEGNAYSATTGEFTVPYSGDYYFTATITGLSFDTSPQHSDLILLVDESAVSYFIVNSINYYEMGTCSYSGHLNKGQKVWLKALYSGYYTYAPTTFSGFLVYGD